MFVFEVRVIGNESKKDHVIMDEVEFVRLLRILKIRNQRLYAELNEFYDKICEGGI
jgi:hypothetical protein